MGGTDDDYNLHFMCLDCHGFESKTLRFPVYLTNKVNEWRKIHAPEESFSSILRVALLGYVTQRIPDIEEFTRMDKRIRELENKLAAQKTKSRQKIDSLKQHSISLMKEFDGYQVIKKRFGYPTQDVEEPPFVRRTLRKG